MQRLFSQAAENNKRPILEVLKLYFKTPGYVLEIGSGTGQHAVFFAQQLPHLQWQPAEMAQHVAALSGVLDYEKLTNIAAVLELDVLKQPWPIDAVDYVYSANTAHIMSWAAVEQMFAGVGRILNQGGFFCLYGPFNYKGAYTSESNAQFDRHLKSRDELSGIRDFEAVDALALSQGLRLVADHAMPANNRTLVWQHMNPSQN